MSIKTELEKIAAKITTEKAVVEFVDKKWIQENLKDNEGGGPFAQWSESGYAIVLYGAQYGEFYGLQGIDENGNDMSLASAIGRRRSKVFDTLHDKIFHLFSEEYKQHCKY